MNKLKIIKYILISFLIAIIILVMLIYIYEKDIFNTYKLLNENKIDVIPEKNKKINFNPVNKKGEEIFVEVLYEGKTIDEIAEKLNKSLKSDLSNTGILFAKHSIEYGVDPYLAVSISLLETGCKWNCSRLVKECNNIGGIKGNPGCFGRRSPGPRCGLCARVCAAPGASRQGGDFRALLRRNAGAAGLVQRPQHPAELSGISPGFRI